MSFADKIGSLMARPNEDLVSKDDVPWWMKYAGRGLGTVGGGIAIFLGVWNSVGIVLGDVSCLLGGVWQMLAGFVVIVVEAPCCCMFIDFVQTLSDWVDKRPYWNRGAFYVAIALPPIFLCFGLSSLFGSGLIFGTGVIYGFMSIGKKASAEEMRTNAIQETTPNPPFTNSAPFANSGPFMSSGMKAPLTENAQDMARDIP